MNLQMGRNLYLNVSFDVYVFMLRYSEYKNIKFKEVVTNNLCSAFK